MFLKASDAIHLLITLMNSLVLAGSTVALPAGISASERTNKNGKALGVRLIFNGTKTATELKAEGKANGLTGAKLREYVDNSLRGDNATAAWLRYDAVTSGLRSNGFVPTFMDGTTKSDTFKIEMKKPSEAKASAGEIEAVKDKAIAVLMGLGLSKEEALASLE